MSASKWAWRALRVSAEYWQPLSVGTAYAAASVWLCAGGGARLLATLRDSCSPEAYGWWSGFLALSTFAVWAAASVLVLAALVTMAVGGIPALMGRLEQYVRLREMAAERRELEAACDKREDALRAGKLKVRQAGKKRKRG
jgi:hypothetical protein